MKTSIDPATLAYARYVTQFGSHFTEGKKFFTPLPTATQKSMKTYYLVARENPECQPPPSSQHSTFESAMTDAKRRAVKNIGLSFVVLKAVAIATVSGPVSTTILED